jgi:anti-sigma B factor antagonist
MSRHGNNATLGESLRPRGPVQLSVTARYEPRVTVVTVGGELDILTAPKLTTRLDDIIRRRHGDVVIDLTATEFIDSLGLHTLLSHQRRLTRQGRFLTVICPAGPARHAIELARLDEALGVVSSFEEYEQRRATRSRP